MSYSDFSSFILSINNLACPGYLSFTKLKTLVLGLTWALSGLHINEISSLAQDTQKNSKWSWEISGSFTKNGLTVFDQTI